MRPTVSSDAQFDADQFQDDMVDDYVRQRPKFDALAASIEDILVQALLQRQIKVAFTQRRAKEVESFRRKASTPSPTDPNRSKYADPLTEITDLAGIRVITLVTSTIDELDKLIHEEFTVHERIDKSEKLIKEERFGYASVHYVVGLTPGRLALPEYAAYASMKAEIQVRTIVQHAWAELEHDIQYKAEDDVPASIRRRFNAVAGALEVVERELQDLFDEDKQLRTAAAQSVEVGRLQNIDITPDALKLYLDKLLDVDARVAQWSYESMAAILRQMGFRHMGDIERCIEGYNDEQLSKIVWGTKRGQLARFEALLLAGMGQNYIMLHPRCDEVAFQAKNNKALQKLQAAGIAIGHYNPKSARR